MKQIRKRLTYANVMSSLAVFLILGGASAYAAVSKVGANEIKANSIKTGKIVKEAVTAGKLKNGAIIESKIADGAVTTNKIADGAVTTNKIADNAVTTGKIANDAVTGDKVKEDTLGTVPNAAKLGGKLPNAYESKGSSTASESIVNLPASTTTTVRTLNLSAGTYLVIGNGEINSNSAADTTSDSVSCTLAVGSESHKVSFGALAKLSEVGDREAFSTSVLATLNAASDATLSCTTPAGWSGNILDTTVSAVSLQP